MAESLAGYLDIVNERIEVQEIAHALQSSHYKEAVPELPKQPARRSSRRCPNSWIDELANSKQFNEELQGVPSYIYKL